jgi:hypothetical protein
MTAWKNIVEDFRKDLPDQFKSFGGISPLTTKTISASLVEGDFDEALQKEIYTAVVHEIGAELFSQLVKDARKLAPVVKHFETMPIADMLRYTIAVWDAATSMSGYSAIIVGPMHLTLMQAAIDSPFVRDEPIEDSDIVDKKNKINPMRRVGMIKNHVVYCDPYASGEHPTLIVAPGWFSYVSSNTLTASKTITLPEDESEIRFSTDVKLTVDSTKIKAVSVDIDRIKFY